MKEVKDKDQEENRILPIASNPKGIAKSRLIAMLKKPLELDPEDFEEYERDSVFVIMSFNETTDERFEIIQEQCNDEHLEAFIVKNATGSVEITDLILDKIRSAEFLIVDLTDERTNVYFELGYAKGIGFPERNILLIARTDTKIHFDISVRNIHFYNSLLHLEHILGKQINKMKSHSSVRKLNEK